MEMALMLLVDVVFIGAICFRWFLFYYCVIAKGIHEKKKKELLLLMYFAHQFLML